MAGNIFVSYRRDDSKHAAGRLVDRLQAEFDEDQLFLDVDNIELGLDFVEVINERVAACDIMLVVIGPQWLNAKTRDGTRRLDDPNDFVRLEIEAALARKIRVIPLLVDGARPVRADDLPDCLAPLANRQSTRLAHETFTADAERLTHALARIVENTAPRSDPPEPAASTDADVRLDPELSGTKAAARDGKPGIEYSAAFKRSELAKPEPDSPGTSAPQIAPDIPNGGRGAAAHDTGGGVGRTLHILNVFTILALFFACIALAVFFGATLGITSLLLLAIIFLVVWAVPFPTPTYVPKPVVAGVAAFVAWLVLLLLA